MATCFTECNTSTEVENLLEALVSDIQDAVAYGDMEAAEADEDIQHVTQLSSERLLELLDEPVSDELEIDLEDEDEDEGEDDDDDED